GRRVVPDAAGDAGDRGRRGRGDGRAVGRAGAVRLPGGAGAGDGRAVVARPVHGGPARPGVLGPRLRCGGRARPPKPGRGGAGVYAPPPPPLWGGGGGGWGGGPRPPLPGPLAHKGRGGGRETPMPWLFGAARLRQLGVLGMNRRNAACILDHNPRAYFPVVD